MALLGVVVNPAANGNRGGGPGEGVIRVLSEAGHDVVDLSATSADAALVAARAACHAGSGRLEALIVVGGDGMVHLGVNAVAGTGVPLGLVAVGTGNDFARTVGLPAHDSPAALRAVLEGLGEPPRPIDLLRSVGADGVPHRTVCVLSAGVDAAINARANGYSFPPGGGKYIRAALIELRRFVPYGYALTLDGQRRELAGTLVAVANGSYFGGGMKIAPHAQLDDGLADVVIADGLSPWQAMKLFPRIYDGSHLRHPAVEVVRAHQVVLEPLDGAPTPPDAYGDGEPVGTLPLTVTVEPGALRLLAPV